MSHVSLRRVACFAALSLAPFSALAAQGRAFQPADWHRVTTLSAPAISPMAAGWPSW